MKVKNLIKKFSRNRHCAILLEKEEWSWDLTYDEAVVCEERVEFFYVDYDEENKEWVISIEIK